MPVTVRSYLPVLDRLRAITRSATREERMQAVVDAIWDSFSTQGVSWVGFYVDRPAKPDAERLLLGPRRDKPACSPLGLHGACGKALTSRRPLIVRDVKELGPNYIACDPRDRSELVIPVIDERGHCWGVLDVDSFELASFDERDAAGMREVLATAGLVSDSA